MPLSPVAQERIEAERLRVAELSQQREAELGSHVQAIQAIRADVESKLRDLQGRCDQLLRVSRRTASEDGDSRYRVYTAAHRRLVGAMTQALKRAEATDRLLEQSRGAREDRARQERERQQRERVQAAVQDVFDLQLPKEDDFEALFGEGVSDAS